MHYLTVRQAADRLGVHPETIRELCRKGPKLGGLTAVKLSTGRTSPYRIAEAELDAWAERNTRQAVAA